MNEINIFDEINKETVRFGRTLSKALEAIESVFELIQDLEEILQPYQIYELLHPRKKPRGSIRRKRRKRRRRGYTAKECYEIGKALYEGMVAGFEQSESEVNIDGKTNDT